MPSIIAADLITSSMRLIGAIETNETPTANEVADALLVLNDMLESWSTDELMVYVCREIVVPLAVGVAVYTLGPTGSVVTARPQRIENAFARWQGVDYPVDPTGETSRYDEISLKTQGGVTPELLLHESSFPDATISVWPVPSLPGVVLHLTVPTALTQVASAAQTLAYPPGYSKALRYCLGVELAPEYGLSVSERVAKAATDARADVMRANMVTPMAAEDPAIMGGSGATSLGAFIGGR
jgi:hypothetical protein